MEERSLERSEFPPREKENASPLKRQPPLLVLKEPEEVQALFSGGLAPSLLCLPRTEDARALLDRALSFWFPRLVRSGYGAVPVGVAMDLGGMLLSGRGERLSATGATFGGPGEKLEERIQRLFQMRAWLEATPGIARLRKLLLERRDDLDRLDGAVLGILQRSALGKWATRKIPNIAVPGEVLRKALQYPMGDILRLRRRRFFRIFQPFLSAWTEGLAAREELYPDALTRLAIESSVSSREPLVSPDFQLLARALRGAGAPVLRRDRSELWVRARRKLSERAGTRLAYTSGGYTGIRKAQTLEEVGRLLSTEWALPEDTLMRRILDKEAPVLEVQGREEPAWEILFTVLVVLDPVALAGNCRAEHPSQALPLWILDDLSRALALDGGRARAEILIVPPDPAGCRHFRFSLDPAPGADPLFLREDALFPRYFLREPQGEISLRARRPVGESGGMPCDLEPAGPRLEIPRDVELDCIHTRPHATHVIAILPEALEFGARYRVEAEEPFGSLDLGLGGNDTLSLVYRRSRGWSLSPLGYPSPGAQVVLETPALRENVLSGIFHRLSSRS